MILGSEAIADELLNDEVIFFIRSLVLLIRPDGDRQKFCLGVVRGDSMTGDITIDAWGELETHFCVWDSPIIGSTPRFCLDRFLIN